MDAANYVLQYLRDTWNESITYTRSSQRDNELFRWVDADWTDNMDTRRTHTGYILMMNGGPISWKIRGQEDFSMSASEAKFVDASPPEAGQDVVNLRETLSDFGYPQFAAT